MAQSQHSSHSLSNINHNAERSIVLVGRDGNRSHDLPLARQIMLRDLLDHFASFIAALESNNDGGITPAAESAVAALKNVKIESEKEAMLCVVCLDSVNVGETIKELPCGHGYHGDCVVSWLATRNTCPVCRFQLPTNIL